MYRVDLRETEAKMQADNKARANAATQQRIADARARYEQAYRTYGPATSYTEWARSEYEQAVQAGGANPKPKAAAAKPKTAAAKPKPKAAAKGKPKAKPRTSASK